MEEMRPPEVQINGGSGTLVVTTSETVGSKRQRRPSVRLGDIGDQPFDSHVRRSNKQCKQVSLKDSSANALSKSSKTRAVMNLTSSGGDGSGGEFNNEILDSGEDRVENLDSVAIGSWKVKDAKKRGSVATKRVWSNWVSKIDEGGGEGEEKYSGAEDVGDEFRDFDMENSESQLKEHSPIHSSENLAVDRHGNERELLYRRPVRGNRDHHDGVELSGPSDTDTRDWKNGERNVSGGRGRCGEEAVRIWLNSIGLRRYAPLFEIHEVDDEVLPMLTLEDLKDMGITAVGSRRKMFCAIQKLGKGFS